MLLKKRPEVLLKADFVTDFKNKVLINALFLKSVTKSAFSKTLDLFSKQHMQEVYFIHKDTRLTLNETVLLSFLWPL